MAVMVQEVTLVLLLVPRIYRIWGGNIGHQDILISLFLSENVNMSFSTSSLFWLMWASGVFGRFSALHMTSHRVVCRRTLVLCCCFIPIGPRLIMKRSEETWGERSCLSDMLRQKAVDIWPIFSNIKSLWHLVVKKTAIWNEVTCRWFI